MWKHIADCGNFLSIIDSYLHIRHPIRIFDSIRKFCYQIRLSFTRILSDGKRYNRCNGTMFVAHSDSLILLFVRMHLQLYEALAHITYYRVQKVRWILLGIEKTLFILLNLFFVPLKIIPPRLQCTYANEFSSHHSTWQSPPSEWPSEPSAIRLLSPQLS